MNSARVSFFIFLLIGFSVLWSEEAMSQDVQDNLIGEVTLDQIIENSRIFKVYVDRYEPDPRDIEYLSSLNGDYSIVVFFGSWCRESTKYTPGLVKTLNLVNNDQIEVTYVGVDEQKKFPNEFLKLFDIKYIPTVVVLKDGNEYGRIVERPQLPIETELVQILKRLQEN
ncbi:thioredoxin family protein [Gracilimonas sp. Q87]|uniref:thioredoxin family protein n=1 Tax=Gracilimonas sp. Q87 TaxID=3384766 RepID=UPI0039842CBC